jgi:hypothetical protein
MTEDAAFIPNTEPKKRNRAFLGVILILLGGLLLMQQFTNFEFHNWWALFIFIPALGSFTSAWVIWQNAGRFNDGVRGSIGSGLITLTVAMIFLMGLSWATWWPLMIIVPGFTFLMSGFSIPGSSEAERPLSRRLYRPWMGWTGLAAMLLGAGFLLTRLGIFSPGQYILNWWAIPILVPAVGGVITALRLLFSGEGFGVSGQNNLATTALFFSNLVTTATFAAVGLIALFGISWNLLTPIIVIAAGLILLAGSFRR